MQPETWFAMQFPPYARFQRQSFYVKANVAIIKITGSDDPESRQAFTNLSTNTPYFSGTDQAQELPDPA